MSNFSREFWNNLNICQENGAFKYSQERTVPTDVIESNNFVLGKIEDTIVYLLRDIGQLTSPSVKYSSRTGWQNVDYVPGFGIQLKEDCAVKTVSMCRDGSSTRFGLTLKGLSMIYRLLQTNQIATKRDLYYDDPKLFKTQATLDTVIDDIGCMLGVPRHMLNVVATSKGFISGDVQFVSADGEIVDCSDSSGGTMVPAQVHTVTSIVSKGAKFILVVEKDATFQRLLNECLPAKLSCIMITGKGVPDVNTRLITRMLSDRLRIPVFGLFDADPHGIEIMCVYRFGSLSLAYDSANLAISNMRWIGLLPSDMKRLDLPQRTLIPFGKRDRNKCKDLLGRPYMKAHPAIVSQVKIIQELDCKAELQALGHISATYLGDVYLPSKIKNGEWL